MDTKLNHKIIGSSLIALGIILIIILGVLKTDDDEKNEFLCKVIENNPDYTMEDCPAHERSVSWLILVSTSIAVLILGAGIVVLIMPYIGGRKADKADLKKLEGEEKQLYEFIKQKEGSAYQSDIMKELGFSKVKTTRLIDKLESKGIAERRRRGMTNIVVLK